MLRRKERVTPQRCGLSSYLCLGCRTGRANNSCSPCGCLQIPERSESPKIVEPQLLNIHQRWSLISLGLWGNTHNPSGPMEVTGVPTKNKKNVLTSQMPWHLSCRKSNPICSKISKTPTRCWWGTGKIWQNDVPLYPKSMNVFFCHVCSHVWSVHFCKPPGFQGRLGTSPQDFQSLDTCRTDFHKVMSTRMVYDLATVSTVALWQHSHHFLDRKVLDLHYVAYSKTLTPPTSHDFGLRLCQNRHWGDWHWPSGRLRVRFSYLSPTILHRDTGLSTPCWSASDTSSKRLRLCLASQWTQVQVVRRNHGGYFQAVWAKICENQNRTMSRYVKIRSLGFCKPLCTRLCLGLPHVVPRKKEGNIRNPVSWPHGAAKVSALDQWSGCQQKGGSESTESFIRMNSGFFWIWGFP